MTPNLRRSSCKSGTGESRAEPCVCADESGPPQASRDFDSAERARFRSRMFKTKSIPKVWNHALNLTRPEATIVEVFRVPKYRDEDGRAVLVEV